MTFMNEVMNNLTVQLTERSESLKLEIMNLERHLNSKKEEYLKIQGALEALQILSNQQSSDQNSTDIIEPEA